MSAKDHKIEWYDDKGGEELSLEAAVLALDQLPAYLWGEV